MRFCRMRLSQCWGKDYYEHIEYPWQIRNSKVFTVGFFSHVFSLDGQKSWR